MRRRAGGRGAAGAGAGAPRRMRDGEGFIRVANVEELEGRKTKAIGLANGENLMLYREAGSQRVFCSESSSTAFQYPMSDAELGQRDGRPTATVPLEGTVYYLDDGAVAEWCAGGNFLQNFFANLKKSQDPVPLQVFNVKVEEDGEIFVDA